MALYMALSTNSTGIVIEAVGKRIRHRDRNRIKPIAYYSEDKFQQYWDLLLAGHFSRCKKSHHKLAKKMAEAYETKDYILFLATLNKIKKLYKVDRLEDFHNRCKNCGAVKS